MRSAIDRPRRGVGSEEARVIAVASLGTVFFILFGPLAGIIAQQFFSQAAVYVAEHAPQRRRGASTAWIQTTGTLGFLLSLATVLVVRVATGEAAFLRWGWRIPFLVSLILLAPSVWTPSSMQEYGLGAGPHLGHLRAAWAGSRNAVAA
jgi:Sugar (and other) transporter